MNTCYNALDVHVNNGRGDAAAIHYDSPLTGTKKSVTYKQLHEQGESCVLSMQLRSRPLLDSH